MTIAFVLSGGASHGATQVGMLLALTEAGISPDLIIGTSAGAINGGWLASRPHVDGARGLAEVWRGLSRSNVFPTHPLVGLIGFLGWRPNLVPNTALRRLLRHHLEFRRLEEAPTPLHVVATDVLSGMEVLLSSGDAVDAITASSAIPAVLPPVKIDGRKMMDGGVVNNTPISHAIDLGADRVYVLSTGYACALTAPPRGVMAMALHALTQAINGRLAADIKRFDGSIDLRVVPPPCPVPISPIDFSHADQLIHNAHRSTVRWLSRSIPPDQSRLLSFHRH